MSSNIVFSYGISSFTLPAPEYDYTVSHSLNIKIIPSAQGMQGWDNNKFGDNFDYRICSCVFLNNASDANDLRNIVRQWRDNTITMQLPIKSGFFPAGPDIPDEGTHRIKLLSVEPEGMMIEPWKYSRTRFKFLIEKPWKSYSIPAADNEGDFQIGSITGLSFPFDYPSPNTSYGLAAMVSQGGEAKHTDRTDQAEKLETAFTMPLNQANAARLLNHLTIGVRNNNLNIIPPAGGYLFGVGFGSTGTYVCRMLNEVISIRHLGHDTFEMPLSFRMISYS